MADDHTPFLGLTLPEVGASRDSWGAKLNADLQTLDTYVAAGTPIGGMIDYAGATAPAGWLLADGSIQQAALYPKLFAVLGNRYGGDGVATFALPDTRGRVIAGVGSTTDSGGVSGTYTLGAKWGYFQWTIGQAHLPSYNLVTDVQGWHSHGGATDTQGAHSHGGATDGQGVHTHNVTSRTFSGGGGTTGAFPIYGAGFGWDGATTDAQGNHAHNLATDVQGSHWHNLSIYGAGNHQHNVNLGGGGQPIALQQPLLAATKIIFAGPPAASETQVAQSSTRLTLRSPVRGNA